MLVCGYLHCPFSQSVASAWLRCIDLEPRTDLAFFELSTPPGELTVSVTDLLGNSYDFRASEPFMSDRGLESGEIRTE